MCTFSNHPFIRLPGLRVSFSQRQTKIKNYNDSNTMLPLTSMPRWFGMVWIILVPLKSHCANASKRWAKKTLILAYFTQCQTEFISRTTAVHFLINQFFSFSVVSYLMIAIYITLIYILKSKIPCPSLYLKLSFYPVIAWNFSNKAMLINCHNKTSTEIPQNISTPSIKAHLVKFNLPVPILFKYYIIRENVFAANNFFIHIYHHTELHRFP